MGSKYENPPQYYEINEASGKSQMVTEQAMAQLSMIICVLIIK
jgi:hypothetical protein